MLPLDPRTATSPRVGAGTGRDAGAGASTHFRAEGVAADGLWRIVEGGRRLLARAERPLEPGMSYRAVLRGDGVTLDGVVFDGARPTAGARVDELLATLRLPADRASRMAVAALMAEGSSLDARRVSAVRSAIAGAGRPGGRRETLAARLAARAVAAGLDPDGPVARRVQAILGPYGRDESSGGGDLSGGDAPGTGGYEGEGGDTGAPGGHADAGGRNGDGRQAGQARIRGRVEFQVPEEELEAALAGAFAAFTESAARDGDLAAFAAPGPAGRGWMCVPFDLSLDGVDFYGTFHILIENGSGRVESLLADVECGGARRVLVLGKDGSTLVYGADDAEERQRFLDAFPGCSVTDVDGAAFGAGSAYDPVDGDA